MSDTKKKQMLSALALLKQATDQMPADEPIGNQMAEICAELSAMVEDEETE